MPTFQTIGVHPSLRSRLVTQSSVIAAASSSSSSSSTQAVPASCGAACDAPTTEGAPPRPAAPYAKVETPLALLACHPESLRLLDPASGECRALTRDQVTTLRQEVAHAMWAETFDGRHVDRVRRALAHRQSREGASGASSSIEGGGSTGAASASAASKRRRRPSPTNVENEHLGNAVDTSAVDGGGEDVDPSASASFPNKRPIVGTLTSLELIRYESLLRGRDPDAPGAKLTTGCGALDKLMSFPDEYGAIMAESTGGGGGAGVPRGHVTQLYGPPASGKTQLALQVAAHRLSRQRSGSSAANRGPPTTTFAQERRRRRPAHFPCWVLVSPAGQVPCAERISELCGNDPATLGQTYFHPVSDIYQALGALAAIEESLSSLSSLSSSSTAETGGPLGRNADPMQVEAPPGLPPPALIVFDGASTCCCFSDPSSDEAMRLLHQLATTLKRIARQHHAAVLVTSGSVMVTPTPPNGQPVGVGAKRMLPALGRIWERAVDIQVKVERLSPPPSGAPAEIRTATLVRHPTKATTSSPAAYFSIHPSIGVRDATGPAA